MRIFRIDVRVRFSAIYCRDCNDIVISIRLPKDKITIVTLFVFHLDFNLPRNTTAILYSNETGGIY